MLLIALMLVGLATKQVTSSVEREQIINFERRQTGSQGDAFNLFETLVLLQRAATKKTRLESGADRHKKMMIRHKKIQVALVSLFLRLDLANTFSFSCLSAILDRGINIPSIALCVIPVRKRVDHQPKSMYKIQQDPTIPSPDMIVPERGTLIRDCKVIKVMNLGVHAEVNPKTGLQGVIYSSFLDVGSIENVEAFFKVGDVIDVKVLGVSTTSGKLLLSRKDVREEEGVEKHKLPDDGRELPTCIIHQAPPLSTTSDPSPAQDHSAFGTASGRGQVANMRTISKQGDSMGFKVREIVKMNGKLKITLSGPLEIALEGNLTTI